MRFYRDSLSEISNYSLDLYKSPSVGANLYLPPLKDSILYLYTLFYTLYYRARTFTILIS